MCGRAGRPGLDPYGEAVLVGNRDTEGDLVERYLDGEPEAVESKLADPASLRTHVLSAVATGFAETEAEILDVFEGTFYAREAGAGAGRRRRRRRSSTTSRRPSWSRGDGRGRGVPACRHAGRGDGLEAVR